MAQPRPSEFAALIVQPADKPAQALIKVFIRLPVLLTRWLYAVYLDTGEFTPEFKQKICAACPTVEEP